MVIVNLGCGHIATPRNHYQAIHCAIYCGGKLCGLVLLGSTSPLIAICSDEEQDVCSQTPQSPLCALVWEAA